MSKLANYKRRYDKAKAEAYQWWPLLEACYHFCIPGRNLFYYTNQSRGAQKNVEIYDTTQVSATNQFVSKLHTALTPPQQTWASFEAATDVPDDIRDELNQELQRYTDTVFKYIRSSNFDIAINECYYDLAVGTACLVINQGDDEEPLRFSSIPLDQIAIEESINHRCETCFRTWGETRIDDIKHLWPNAALSRNMLDQLEKDPNATVQQFVEAIIYNNDDKVTPYSYVLWHGDDVLLDEKHESSEFIIFRWSKVNNEVFGRGPIVNALPSIRSLQTAAYFEMTAANLNICKPYMAYSDGVFNPYTFRMAPNSIIPISPNSGGQYPIIPLPDVANPAFMQLTTMDLRQQINTLLMANPLGSITETPNKTATEVAIRQRNLAEEIGPVFTRLQQEFLDRILDRIRYVLVQRGLLPKVVTIKGHEISIKYKSPLTISQGQQDVSSFMQYMQIMQNIVGPEMAIAYTDTTRLSQWLGEKMGVDATLINTREEMQAEFQRQQQEQQAMQAMQMMQLQEGMGETPVAQGT